MMIPELEPRDVDLKVPGPSHPRPKLVPRWFTVLGVVVFAAFLASAGGLWLLRYLQAHPPEPKADVASEDYAELRIPEFTLTTQDRRTITRADLLGKVTVMDFMFTHCPFICPTLTLTMRDQSDKLVGGRLNEVVRFLSVSVDPIRDTPERLREYAKDNLIDTRRWSLATGPQAEVDRIVQEGLKFVLQDDAKNPILLPEGGTMNNIIHPGWFVLVGPDAKVLGIYRASQPEEMARMRVRIEAVVDLMPR